MNELLDDVALRVRHNAAMDAVDHTGVDEDERYELLWDVLVPSRRLLEVSLERARDEVARRYRNDQAAA